MKNIKKSLILSLLLWSIMAQMQTIQAQKANKINYFTLYGGISLNNAGEGYNIDYSLESIFYNNYGVGISRTRQVFERGDYPDLYRPWLGHTPNEVLQISSLYLIKKVPLSRRFRLGTEFGVSHVNSEIPIIRYFPGTPGSFKTGPYPAGYKTYGTEYRTTTGIRTRISIDWLLTSALGMELSVKTDINRFHSTVTADIKIIAGFLRKRIKK